MLCSLVFLQLYKVLYPYTPRKEDELELIEDDFVFVSIADQGQTGDYIVWAILLSTHTLLHVLYLI